MEFEEMKKIWDSQNNEVLYCFNEKALHNRIQSKKSKAYQITNISELLWIITHVGVGSFCLITNSGKTHGSISVYLLSAWLLGTALYLIVSRARRIRANAKFDRSMRGDLDFAIAVSTYQVRLSTLGRLNIIPVTIISLMTLFENGKSLWLIIAMLIFFVLVIYAAGWEHRIYEKKKRELEILKSKLDDPT